MRRHLLILLLMAPLSSLAAQVAVVNPSVPEVSIDARRMAALLQGRITTWEDGTPVVLVLAQDPLADVHLSHIAGREREVLLRGWKRLVFAGSGAMPLTARSVEEGLALVAKTSGAVLLLDHADMDPRWRVMPITLTAER
ncbi:MAG TPA: hypothetical protein VHX44_12135 [Planctomycetota bacterium]|jgi:hypothetical protein|nr:hypothetical protein [Planctomycetota bacterium]